MNISGKPIKPILLLLSLLTFILLFASCSVLTGLQEVDPQSATLTALVTPTSVQPTLDLKGNVVLENQACEVFTSPSISTFDDAEDGGIFGWAENKNTLAFVIPENRYWAWFSGDVEIVDFETDADQPPTMNTSGIQVYGDFEFNPSATKIAFVIFRPSEKIYSVMTASLGSSLQITTDLFSDTAAQTDNYSSSKSVLNWLNDDEVIVSSSCGIDCEQLYTINTVNGTTQLGEQVRKKGHSGRDFSPHTLEYDDRDYPAMINPNWSPDEEWIFYLDAQDKTWILNVSTRQQFELPVSADTVYQTAWSYDASYIAIRFRESLSVYKINCDE